MRKTIYYVIFFLALSFQLFGHINNSENDILNPIGILIHGCHLEAIGWEKIVLEDLDGKRLGRTATGIQEAINKQAQLIFWGTGASEKKGLKESEYTYKKALKEKRLAPIALRMHKDLSELKKYLEAVSVKDTKSQNTDQEIRAAIKECQKRGIHELILVSSPTHIFRCLQAACKIQAEDSLQIKFYALSSDIGFFKLTPLGEKVELKADSVTIIEPPHRGDTPKIYFNETLKDIFQFLKNPELAKRFDEDLKQLIKDYKKNSVNNPCLIMKIKSFN